MNLPQPDSLTTPLHGQRAAPGLAHSRLAEEQRAFSDVLGRARGPDESPESRARKAAEDLVAIALIQPILKQFRESDKTAPPFAPSSGEKQFRALLDAELAQRMVSSGRWDLVDSVARKLLEQNFVGARYRRDRGSVARSLNMPVIDRRTPHADIAAELESLLTEFNSAYTDLSGLVSRQRESLRAADSQAVAELAQAQQAVLERLSGLDQLRRALSARSGARQGSPAPTLRQIAQTLPEPHRNKLLRQVESLRSLMERTRAETGTVRAATLSLVAHLEGLMRQVGRTLSHAGTYGRAGRVDPAGAVVTALDLRS